MRLEENGDTTSDQRGYQPPREELPEGQVSFRLKEDLLLPNRSKVFPDPSFPQMSDISPGGNWRVRSTSWNLCLGVEAVDPGKEGVALLLERSWGQVTVHDWKAIVCDCSESGRTGATSRDSMYFSIRRIETKHCRRMSYVRVKNKIIHHLKHIDEGFG